MDCLSQYARQRLHEEMVTACRQFFASLHGRLGERLRDMGFCRQRLRHLQENLDNAFNDSDEDMTTTRAAELTPSHSPAPSPEAYWEAIRQSPTARVVLPAGEEDLERAACRFLLSVTPEQWVELDRELHERALAPRGGLHGACINSGDMTRTLMAPLLDEAITLLGKHLPIMDVAQILGAELEVLPEVGGKAAAAPDLAERTKVYLESAAPLLGRHHDAGQHSFLLVPGSEAGKALGEAFQKSFPGLKTVRVPGQADLMFCREQGALTPQELQKLLRICRATYEAAAVAPQTSPHARFDITDWVPLDP
jgi:hypothetical protein